MKAIKKVKISNIPKTEGAVVDSVSSNVDQTTNAPSIRAILEKIQQVASNIIHAITADRLKTARKIKIIGAVKGEASFDGSKDVTITTTQDNIAVIEGSITVPAGPDNVQFVSKTEHIDFPAGFNKDNCFVFSIGTKYVEGGTGYGYGYGTVGEYDVFSLSENLVPFQVLLGNGTANGNRIQIVAENNYMEQINVRYLIVLMKKNPQSKEKIK